MTIKIKALASRQAECSHVSMWPTVFGRTIINLRNYNWKHNEEKPCRSWMRSETPSPHRLLPTVLSSTALREPKCPAASSLAGTEPSIFILGDGFLEGEPSLALCPERLAADKLSGFAAGLLSRADLASREHPALGIMYIYNHHRESAHHVINHKTCMHRSL